MTSQVVKYIILSVNVDVLDTVGPRFGKPWALVIIYEPGTLGLPLVANPAI